MHPPTRSVRMDATRTFSRMSDKSSAVEGDAQGLDKNTASVGMSSGRGRTLPEQITIVVGGQRFRMRWASSRPSISPGILISVKTTRMSVRPSKMCRACAELLASTTSKPLFRQVPLFPSVGAAHHRPTTLQVSWRGFFQMQAFLVLRVFDSVL